MIRLNAYQRVKHLRKDILKLSQEEFSKRINLSRSNLGNIETGKINLTERVITDICREFYTSSKWIADGEEPIFIEDKNPQVEEIVKLFSSLTEDNQKYLYGYVQRLLEEQGISKESE